MDKSFRVNRGSCFASLLLNIILMVSVCSGIFTPERPYDFIVVGGGTAGCAVTRRLAESGRYSVLLIESGDVPPEDLQIPAYAPRFVQNTNLTFRFPSFPQKLAAKRRAGITNSITGRMLGGSSSINYMWVNRGSPRDYDNWAKITKDQSWNYKNMLRHFRNIETYSGEFPSDQHGSFGPITVSQPRYAPGLQNWLEAGQSLGYSVNDPNGPQKIGFAPNEFSKKFGRRVSSYTGYLQPILSYSTNVHILLNTNVTEIIFNGKQAVGVRFSSNQDELNQSSNQAFVSKEIIISAGNLNTPLILLRSGIGPKEDLLKCGINVVSDLPTGLSFHDHVALPIHMFINDTRAIVDEKNELNEANLEYFNRVGDGPYSNTRGGTGQAFVASSVAKAEGEGDWADLHICMAHSNEPYLSAYIPNDSGEVGLTDSDIPMSAALFLVRPKSRGTLRLNLKDPYGLPILDVGYFTDPKDSLRMLDGIKESIRIFEGTDAYKRIGAQIVTIEYEECEGLEYRSDEYWHCYIRFASQAGLHSGGTARMGYKGDPMAVTDSKLKVFGVNGLRVIDTSIMPVQPNINTQVPAYAIAEKGSEMILQEWEQQHTSRFRGLSNSRWGSHI